ncbi:MAG: hypothetical protein PHF56_21485 [Desulfuromonadaceae bacterium]|nr:hypothetical protein [Desulfuromonadaceae bacterium]
MLWKNGADPLYAQSHQLHHKVGYAGSIAPDNQNDYWLIKLGASRLLSAVFSAGGIRKFRFRLTGASELQAAQNWSDLSERYASFVEKSVAAI